MVHSRVYMFNIDLGENMKKILLDIWYVASHNGPLPSVFKLWRERNGSVVECLTRDRRAAGSSLTGITALWSLSKTHLS